MLRGFSLLLSFAMSVGALAQGALGTKKDIVLPESKPLPGAGALGGMQLVQLVVALGIVIVILKFILPKLVGKFNKRINTSLGSSIKVEESATFAGGNLFVVSARSKTLLLCVTPQAVNCLADLTEPAAQGEQEKAFFEVLDEATPSAPVAATAAAEIADHDIRAALDRLARLEG